MKKLFILMASSLFILACNNEADTTDSTTVSGDTMLSEPVIVDTASSSDTTARLRADSAIRK